MRNLSLLFIIVGVSLMAYTAFEFFPQLAVGQHGQDAVNQALKEEPEETEESSKSRLAHYQTRPKINESFGELIIPKLEAVLPIVEGTDPDQLEKGVGHYAKSVLPGEDDNSVLSGHRDTVFRKVGQLKVGDLLIVTTSAGRFTYKITKTWVVDEDDRTVIVSHKGKQILTLSTCYPFDYVGSAPERYIIQATIDESSHSKKMKNS